MKWGQIQGKWAEYKGQVKQRWGKLTDNDLMVINGKRDVLVGKLLEQSGATKAEIEKQIVEFESSCCSMDKPVAKAAGCCGTTESVAAKIAGKKT